MLVIPVALEIARSRTPITPVTARAAKLVRIMNLKDFWVRMAYERAGERVRLFPWPTRRHVFSFDIYFRTRSEMTDFAAVYNVEFRNIDLMTQYRIIELLLGRD